MRLPTYRELSKEQDRIYNLPLDTSCLVTGPPGTGKTVMALYRASALAGDARNVELLMYSRLLHQYVETALKDLEIEGLSSTFHSWFGGWWRRNYHENFPQIERYVPDWDTIMRKIGERPPAADQRPYMIVDEAQDMSHQFFMMLSLMADGVTIFADENQRISEENSTLKQIRALAQVDKELQLLVNYRNSTEIARLAEHFFSGTETGIAKVSEDRERGLPELRRFGSFDDELKHILRYVRTYSDLEVGVFLPTKPLLNKFYYEFKKELTGPHQVQRYIGGKGAKAPATDWDAPGVKVVTYRSSKGLEFDAVFAPQLERVTWDLNIPDLAMQFYVLATRAREHLVFSYTGKDEPEILSLFPEDDELLDRRL